MEPEYFLRLAKLSDELRRPIPRSEDLKLHPSVIRASVQIINAFLLHRTQIVDLLSAKLAQAKNTEPDTVTHKRRRFPRKSVARNENRIKEFRILFQEFDEFDFAIAHTSAVRKILEKLRESAMRIAMILNEDIHKENVSTSPSHFLQDFEAYPDLCRVALQVDKRVPGSE